MKILKFILIWGVLSVLLSSISACASYQTEMNNPLPNEHDVPVDQTMPANDDSSVSLD